VPKCGVTEFGKKLHRGAAQKKRTPKQSGNKSCNASRTSERNEKGGRNRKRSERLRGKHWLRTYKELDVQATDVSGKNDPSDKGGERSPAGTSFTDGGS